MRTSAISAVIAALCKSSADASTLVRVRTQSRRKSQLSSRVRRDVHEVFLDNEPAFRQLELSMIGSISSSSSFPFGGAEIGGAEGDGQDDGKTNTDAALATAEVTAEVAAKSG